MACGMYEYVCMKIVALDYEQDVYVLAVEACKNSDEW